MLLFTHVIDIDLLVRHLLNFWRSSELLDLAGAALSSHCKKTYALSRNTKQKILLAFRIQVVILSLLSF